MDTYKLNAKTRTITGKKVKALRRDKQLPGAIYDEKGTTNITLNTLELDKVLSKAGSNTLIDITLDEGKTPIKVLMQEAQLNPRNLSTLHVSFHKVNLDEEVNANIPVELIGESPAVKSLGGIAINPLPEIEVTCLPQHLPHTIQIDISKLENIGDSIYLSDILLGEHVKLTIEDEEKLSEMLVVSITPPTVEPEPSEESAEAEVGDIELSVKKGKEEETEEATE